MMEIILASGSPRRKEILSNLGVAFKVVIPDVDEAVEPSLAPGEAVRVISKRKALAVSRKAEGVIIAADTVVFFNGKILGKPRDEKDAYAMLSALSGSRHQVFTGVTIINNGREESFVSETAVEFYALTDKEILDYIASGEPMDKAGAYGIQGLGALFVKRIEGDYLNTVGLPAAETLRRVNQVK